MAAGPTKDVKEFQFKICGQLRVFSPGEKINIESPVKLVATASKFGFTFCGTPSGLICIVTNSVLYHPDIQHRPLSVASEFPRRALSLPSQPSHLDVSPDSLLLAVAIRIQDIPVLQIYSVPSFSSSNVVKKVEMRMSNVGGVKVVDLQWNPGLPGIVSAVMSDGSVVLYEIKDSSFSLNSLPPSTQARCLCWSPKGKQVVIGSADGSLTQFKPDLKAVKTFPPPFQPATVLSVHWPSSFQFIAAYLNMAVSGDRPVLTVVNVPKGAQPSYIRYDDVCFGSLAKRPEFFFIHQQVWNTLVVGCGDSMELSVLGLDPSGTWVHWKQDDSTRAELPLTEDKDDVHNLGISLDTSPVHPIQINESVSVGPMPRVLSLSHDGVLVLFTALNLLPGSPSVCSPPELLPDQSGLPFFTTPLPKSAVQQVAPVAQPAAPTVQPQQAAPAFSQTNPTLSQTSSILSQPSPILSQPSTILSQPNPVLSQPSPILSQPGGILSQPNPVFSQSNSMLSQPNPSQPSTILSQPSPLFSSTLAQPGGQPSLLTQPSLYPQSSPFSPTTSLLPKTGSLFSNLQTPSPASAKPLTLLPSQDANSTKPFMSTTTPTLSFANLSQQNTTSPGLAKPVDTGSISKPTVQGGLFNLDSSQSFSKKEESEAKPVNEKDLHASSQPTVESNQSEEKIDSTEIDNAAYMAAIYDELKLFQKEYSEVQTVIKGNNVKVGDEKIKGEVSGKIDRLEEFGNELVETTQAQVSEVSSLRMSLLDMISRIQLIKTKRSISNNLSLIEMREAEGMDPIGKHWCKQIEQRLYALQSQVKQAIQQVESIKNAKFKGGLKIPTFETIIQTIINENRIVDHYKGAIASLENQLEMKAKRLAHRRRKIIQSDRTISGSKIADNSQLSALAQKLLQTKMEAVEDKLFSYREGSQEMIAMRSNKNQKLGPNKKEFLKRWHSNHKVIHTKLKVCPPKLVDLQSPLRPSSVVKQKEVMTTKDVKDVTPEPVVLKPVSSTPVGRPEMKPAQISRNLFANFQENSLVLTQSTPNMKGLFQGGVTSTPLVADSKKDPSPLVVAPSTQSDSPPISSAPLQTPIISPQVTSPKIGSSPFNVISPSPSQLQTPLKTSISKTPEVQSKPVGQMSKESESKLPQNPPIFSFSSVNKENIGAENVPASSASLGSSILSKALTTSGSVFEGFHPTSDKKEEGGTASGFSFGSLSNTLKSLPATVEKSQISTKTENPAPPSVPQAFSFGSLSLTTTVASTTSAGAPAAFSFSQVSIPGISPQTTSVSSTVKPISFSLSEIKPTTTSAAVTTSSSFSFTDSLSSSLAASVTPVSTAVVPVTNTASAPLSTTAALPAQSPVATSTSIFGSSSPSVKAVSLPAFGSDPSVKPLTTVFGASSETVPVSTVSPSTPVIAPTLSVSTAPTTPTTTASQSLDALAKPPTTSAPAFSTPAFGSFTPASTSAPSLFGSAAAKFSTPATTTSVFGLSTTSAPLFNQASTTTTSPFAQAVTSTPASPFSQTPSTQAPSSPFSPPATTSSFTPAPFGSGPVFSSTPAFPSFGTATTSVFGSTTTTASPLFSTPLFGQAQGGAPSSPFGAPPNQPSPFNAAAPSAQTPASPFGSASPPANPFFNQSQPSVFGQAASQGNFGSSGGSIFGGTSSFGSSAGTQFQSPSNSIFGGAGGGPFSSTSNQSVGQTGFGSPPSFQTAKPAGGFGSGPVFGSSPSFGGAPAFGNTASFGSPNKVFGATNPAPPVGGNPGFGGQPNMFESLANQNTMSFGNLAQAQQSPPLQPTFGSPQQPQPQPPTFGGNSFSSWR